MLELWQMELFSKWNGDTMPAKGEGILNSLHIL